MKLKKPAKAKTRAQKQKAAPQTEGFCYPDTTVSKVVLVNADLKKVANEYQNAWHQCVIDVIEQELPDLCARFLRVEEAQTALNHARAFTDYLASKGVASLKLTTGVASQNLPLSVRIILPEIFYWPARDIVGSNRDYDVVRGCEVEAAELYLAIFTNTHFKRLVSEIASQGKDQQQKLLLTNTQKAHGCLLAFLREMLKQARRHIVKIGNDLSVEIDGQVSKAKGAGKRGLLALAVIRNKKTFSAAEFNDVFYGTTRSKGEVASEFTTAMRDVKKLLPGLGYESDNKGNRTVSEVFFVVQASDEELQQAIAELRGDGKK